MERSEREAGANRLIKCVVCTKHDAGRVDVKVAVAVDAAPVADSRTPDTLAGRVVVRTGS